MRYASLKTQSLTNEKFRYYIQPSGNRLGILRPPFTLAARSRRELS